MAVTAIHAKIECDWCTRSVIIALPDLIVRDDEIASIVNKLPAWWADEMGQHACTNHYRGLALRESDLS